MDSLTQIVLGASVGELVLGKKVGNRAALWGAIGGTIPDLDVLAQYMMNPIDALLVHRGFSHSILFCILTAPIFGWIVWKIHKNQPASWKDWSWLFFWALFTHPLLDAFTTWGTQLFWPFESRLAYKSIFVIDPLYTFPFLILLSIALFKPKSSDRRRRLNKLGLIISTSYLILSFANKLSITPIFERALEEQNIQYSKIETKPMPLQNLLWTANVASDSGYYIGYYSRLDKNSDIHFNFYEHNKKLLSPNLSDDVSKAISMTQGWYTVDQLKDTLIIHDLRFGIIGDFKTGEGEFVFDYLAKPKLLNERVYYRIEQKRNSFQGSDKIFNSLLNRIAGNKE